MYTAEAEGARWVFADRSLASGELEAARAALHLRLARGGQDPNTWLGLHHLELSSGRHEAAMEVAEAARAQCPDDVGVALLLPRTLAEARRSAAAQDAYREVAERFPHDWTSLVALCWLSYMFDPETTFWGATEAVRRGFNGHDDTLTQGAAAAGILGEFEAGRELCRRMQNPEWRAQFEARLAHEEREWAEHEAQAAERYPDGISVLELERMAHAGEHGLGVHLMWRRLRAGDLTGVEHAFLLDLSPTFGWHQTQLIYYAAHTTRRYVECPQAMFRQAGWLASNGAFTEAGAIVARPDLNVINSDQRFGLAAFCCAAGGMEVSALADMVRDPYGSTQGHSLATDFVRNVDAPPDDTEQPDLDALAPLRRRYRTSAIRRPRVALCISGQLRSFRQTWAETKRAVEPWQPVVFVDTWADVGSGFGSHESVDRALPIAVRLSLPIPLRLKSCFQQHLPRTLEALTGSSQVDTAELQAFYDTPYVQVHDEAAFEAKHAGRPEEMFVHRLNQAKMFFTFYEVNAQKARYEAEKGIIFDAVIRLRPDRRLVWLGSADVERVIRERVLLGDYFLSGGIGDQNNLCSSEVFDRMAEIWPALERQGDPRYFPGSSGRYAEFLVAEHMMSKGVRLGRHTASFSHGITPLEGDIASLWPAVLQDASEGPGGSDDRRSVIAAFCEAAAGAHAAGRGELAVAVPAGAAWLAEQAGLSEAARAFLASNMQLSPTG